MDVSDQYDREGRRLVAVLVPYRNTPDGFEFFLQFRDGSAPVHARMFSMFGGGIAVGETPEAGMIRETHEELAYTPRAAVFFCAYTTQRSVFHIFFEEVGEGFEHEVDVQEGEYGKFLAEQEVFTRPDVSPITKLAIEEFMAPLRRS